MNHPNDYIKLNDNNTSRPIVGVYELSSILTNTSELLANTPNLNEFLKDDDKIIDEIEELFKSDDTELSESDDE